MAQRLRWRNLATGMIALAVIVVLSFVILVFGRLGALHGRTTHLFASTDEARGVVRGTEVWLNGQKIGAVDGVTFRPPSADTTHRLLISLQILEPYRDQIRRNSNVRIEAGGSLISSQVVSISGGTPAAPAVAPGDTIESLPQADVEGVTSQIAVASRDFPAIIQNVKLLNAALHSAKGTLGALGGERGADELRETAANASGLFAHLSSDHGTVGLALHTSPSLMARAQQAMASADSLRQLVFSDRSSIGRFRRDSTLMRAVSDVRTELSIVQSRLASPDGTVGRFRADSSLLIAVAQSRRQLTALFADLRRHPLRYLSF